MGLTLEQLQAQRDGIVAQLGGASDVRFADGKGVSFRPQDELEAALERIDVEIAKLQSPQSRLFTVQTNRGIS